jgi:hypothetical protein
MNYFALVQKYIVYACLLRNCLVTFFSSSPFLSNVVLVYSFRWYLVSAVYVYLYYGLFFQHLGLCCCVESCLDSETSDKGAHTLWAMAALRKLSKTPFKVSCMAASLVGSLVTSPFPVCAIEPQVRHGAPMRAMMSCHQHVRKFELRCGYGSAGDNESDKSLCHSVKIISFISQRKTSIPLRRSFLSVTGWYARSSCKTCSRKFVVLEDARNVVMHELVVTNSSPDAMHYEHMYCG